MSEPPATGRPYWHISVGLGFHVLAEGQLSVQIATPSGQFIDLSAPLARYVARRLTEEADHIEQRQAEQSQRWMLAEDIGLPSTAAEPAAPAGPMALDDALDFLVDTLLEPHPDTRFVIRSGAPCYTNFKRYGWAWEAVFRDSMRRRKSLADDAQVKSATRSQSGKP